MSDKNLQTSIDNKASLMDLYSALVAKVCSLGLAIATLLLLFDTALVGVNIVMRYIFHHSILGTEELVSASLTIIVMLSAPEVLRRGSHIGVDILVDRLSLRYAKIAAVWSAISVLGVSVLLIINGWKAMQLSKMIGSLTEGYIEMPVWALQLFLPLGGLLLGLAAIELLFKPIKNTTLQDVLKAGEI